MKITAQKPEIKKRVDGTLRFCGFSLRSFCIAYDIKQSTAAMTLDGERRGRESQKILRRLASFFEEQGYHELAQDLRSLARLWDKEAA